MRIFALNPNVGSAIEYMGDTLVEWLREVGDVYNCKHQTRTSHYLKMMYDYNPDIVVANEFYYRATYAANIYKHLTGTPFVHVDHVWKRLNLEREQHHNEFEYEVIKEVREEADWIFCVNYKPHYESWHKTIENKVSNRYYATNPDVFKVTKPWTKRNKMFCYIGNLLPHKLSSAFLEKLVCTNLVVDAYGKENSKDAEYIDLLDNAIASDNLQYYGLIDQDKIADVMNEYKYLVVPHHGQEPFNWVIKQCMHCGTIPLVVNDRHSVRYDGRWLDWASGLYLGCANVDEFIVNLIKIRNEQPDWSGISELVAKAVRQRFPYQEFKDEFQEKVRELCHG